MKSPLALVLAVALAGCAGGAARSQSSAAPDAGRLITAAQIRESGATTVWEALKFNVRTHYFGESKGNPAGIQSKRGRGSMVLREEPLIFLDGAQLGDYQVLRHMPASSVASIRVLGSADGTTYYGTNAVGGVILIATSMGH